MRMRRVSSNPRRTNAAPTMCPQYDSPGTVENRLTSLHPKASEESRIARGPCQKRINSKDCGSRALLQAREDVLRRLSRRVLEKSAGPGRGSPDRAIAWP